MPILILAAVMGQHPVADANLATRVARLEEWKSFEQVTQREIKEELKAISAKLDNLPQLADHESRIRSIESLSLKAAGGFVALQALMGVGLTLWLRRKNGRVQSA